MTGPTFMIRGPADAPLTLALAHGAGAPMDSPFMEWFADALSDQGLRVVRFEFAYMHQRRHSGVRKPPNAAPVLLDTWRSVIEQLGPDALLIGGKSMGGRMASMLADETGVRGLVCLGYPFHPPGKPERTRIDHLADLSTPALICQGERDPFGKRQEVEDYPLSRRIRLAWLADGDHGFKPRKSSGRDERGNWAEAVEAIMGFVHTLAD